MMRLYGAIVILFLALGTAAAAQQSVRIRSGEHKTFSRLVLETETSIAWELVATKNGYDLVFSQANTRFDLTNVFRFIPKRRLVSLAVSTDNPNVLRLEVATDHHAKAMEIAPGKLVIDIKQGARPAFVALPPLPAGQVTEPSLPTPPPQTFVLQPPSHRPGIPEMTRMAGKVKQGAGLQDGGLKNRPSTLRLPDIRVIGARQRLIEQLDRAADQGVIEPSNEYKPTNQATATKEKAENRQPLSAVTDKNLPTIGQGHTVSGSYLDHLNVQVQTVFDRDRPKLPDGPIIAPDGQVCLADEELDLEHWKSDRPARDEIADLRQSLSGELDRPDYSVLEKLAKLYVFMGFGTEARALLATYPGQLAAENLLIELSYLIESGQTIDNGILGNQAHCPGRSAMWAVLARPEIPLGEAPDGAMLSRHFAALPADLRWRIGPVLATRLLDAGFQPAAIDIANLIARAPGQPSTAYLILKSRLDLAMGHKKRAEKTLLTLINNNTALAPQALILLVTNRLGEKTPVSDTLIAETAARAHELRNSTIGLTLRRLEILSWAARQHQNRAFEILTHEAALETLDPKAANTIANEIFLSFATESSHSGELVQAFFRFRYLLTNDPAMDRARRQVAQSLLNVGLPATALDVLIPIEARMTDQDRYLLSRIYLHLARPKAALDILGEDVSPPGTALRAKALAQLGQYGQAIEIAQDILEPKQRDDLAWQAGRWDIVAASDIASRRMAAGFVQGTDGSASNTADRDTQTPVGFKQRLTVPIDLSIEGLKVMLEQSENTRIAIDALMADHPHP